MKDERESTSAYLYNIHGRIGPHPRARAYQFERHEHRMAEA